MNTREYLKNVAADAKATSDKVKALQEAVAELNDKVEGIANDSEANAQAIVELAEIIGG